MPTPSSSVGRPGRDGFAGVVLMSFFAACRLLAMNNTRLFDEPRLDYDSEMLLSEEQVDVNWFRGVAGHRHSRSNTLKLFFLVRCEW